LRLLTGANVFPREIDEVLYAHPDVAKAVPLGGPEDHYGEVIHASVTLRPNMNSTAEDLITYEEPVLARDMVPISDYHRVLISKTTVGKIDNKAQPQNGQNMEHSHHPGEIRARLEEGPKTSYLSDWVYGGIDGAITTFAIVAGVVGAEMSTRVILILGAANIIADGFSMAASNYSGTKAELDDYRRHRAYEEQQVERIPEAERREIREIYRNKGFDGAELERVVEVITADKERWVDTMMVEEYGMPSSIRDPIRAGLCTFAAFILCGLAPLVPFFLPISNPFETAIALTAVVFFVIGSIKAQWSTQPWWRSGTETLAIGLAAAGIAWLIGHLLKEAFL